jgi:AcrR family transcriptional regulator
MKNTKDQILDAAERLFAEHGYDAASLRAITAEAGVNLAAVNYHFSSKEALFGAVFARKLAPISRQRLDLLDALEAKYGSGPLPLDRLVRALIEPPLRLLEQPDGAGMRIGVLLGRMYSSPVPAVRRLFIGEINESIQRFQSAFRRSLPNLPPDEVFWRVFFAIGAMTQILAAGWMVPVVSGGRAALTDIDSLIERLTAYLIAGLNAPLRPGRMGKTRSVKYKAEPIVTKQKLPNPAR